MALLDSLVELVSRIRLSRLFPIFAIGAEGAARLCRSAHSLVIVLGVPERPAPLHVDVELGLWNKSRIPVSVSEPVHAEAAGQELRWEEPGHWGAFEEATLEVGGRRKRESFRLFPPKGEELRARARDRLLLELRLSSGRPRKVKLDIAERRP